MSCSIVSVASHSTTEPSLHMCDSAGYWNSKDKGSLQFACNKSKEEHITYGDGGLKTWSTLFVPVGSSIWDTDAAHISMISWGVSGLGREEQHRCLAHSHAHPLTVPALCTHHPHAQIVRILRPSMWDQPICLHYILGRNDCIHIDVNNAHKMVLFVEENIILTTLTMWH